MKKDYNTKRSAERVSLRIFLLPCIRRKILQINDLSCHIQNGCVRILPENQSHIHRSRYLQVLSITLVFFAVMGIRYANGASVDLSAVNEMSQGLTSMFHISPWLLLPPVIVIVAVARKVPALPGITLGIFAGVICGFLFQDGITYGDVMVAGMSGFTCESGIASLDSLLSTGGIENMMFSISLTMIAMMFGGIMEKTGMLAAVVKKIIRLAKSPVGLITTTEFTCFLSNLVMPEQYISVVIPGRMYADTYREMGLHPKTLSNALESAGTVTSVLVPWNTCSVYVVSVLGVSTMAYLPYCFFNLMMPFMTILLAFFGVTVARTLGGSGEEKE